MDIPRIVVKHKAVGLLGILVAMLFLILTSMLWGMGSKEPTEEQNTHKTQVHASTPKMPKEPPLYTFPKGGRDIFPQYRLVALYARWPTANRAPRL
jgi:hypothetical protein